MIFILISENGVIFSQTPETFSEVSEAIAKAKTLETGTNFVSVEETTETGNVVHYLTLAEGATV